MSDTLRTSPQVVGAAAGYRGRSPPVVPVLPSASLATHIKTTGCRVLPLTPDALEYTRNDVPEPLLVGLAIEPLAAIWDDSWPTWKNISPLVIKERPVPLKHFRSVYIGSSEWKSVRHQWLKWKVSGLSQYSHTFLTRSLLFCRTTVPHERI